MVQPSPSYTVALYLEVPASQKAVARLVDTATATGAIVTGVDVADSVIAYDYPDDEASAECLRVGNLLAG